MKNIGTDSVLQNKVIREKCCITCLKKYGVDIPAKSKQIYNKIENTCIARYGSKNYKQSKEFNSKIYKKLKETDWKEYAIPLFDETDYDGFDKIYKWKCVKCGNEFYSDLKSEFLKRNGIYIRLPRCLKCYPLISGFSYKELELLDFVKQYFPNAGKDRKIIAPLELDIVIHEIKLAIEFNGVYFHSLNNSKGYRLIHIWEDEWNNNKEEIKLKLKNIFKGEENLLFKDKEVILDRSWFNCLEIPGYILKKEISSEIVIRDGFEVEDCGKLVYIKIEK